MVVTTFAYDSSGRMQWYYSDGPLSAGGYHWSGQLLKFDFGQPLNGIYTGSPTNVGNDGTLTLDFTSKTTGYATLPGGRRIAIQRENFGVGSPPQALLGEWIFAYSIGSSNWLDRYRFTTIAGATSSGTGVVVDGVNVAAMEYQVSGTFAGQVVGFHYSSTGSVMDQYLWQLMLEEGRGSWVSPTTYNMYGMNVYKTATISGMAKTKDEPIAAADLDAKGFVTASPRAISIEQLAAVNPEVGRLAVEMWNAVRK